MSAEREALRAFLEACCTERGLSALALKAAMRDTLAEAAEPAPVEPSGEARDAARWRWAKPILAGDDDETADARADVIAKAILSYVPIEQAIDAAIAAQKGGAL